MFITAGLLSIDFEDASDTSSAALCHGWTIDTKYYKADVSIWMAHLEDGFSIKALPVSNNLAALVMVFDMNDFVRGRRTVMGIRESCLEWCSEYNIEYIEACLSVDGDSQGVERLHGALSAHMWPGMVLKSGNMMISQPYAPEKEEDSSEDEPDYDIEYEILSAGSADPWDDTEEVWVSSNGTTATADTRYDIGSSSSSSEIVIVKKPEEKEEMTSDLVKDHPSTPRSPGIDVFEVM
ncbi:hypothetical protein MKX01_001847 [Papaver californicum]|nr:hypothetical protein MKX01_001847 [Papaver californicum]